MAFQLTKFSYKSLRKLNMQERIAVAQDREMGQWLLSLLTPSQMSELFPRYYRESTPDISGFMKAMPTSMSAAKLKSYEEQIQNTTSGSAAGANFKSGGWRKKWQEGMDEQRAIASKKGVTPPPQLSPEQQKIWDSLRQSPLASDDPRAKMFAGLSAEQLGKANISKYSEGGKEFFRYTPPTVSEEEAKKSIKSNLDTDPRTGGSRSWRNKNPGNIEFGEFARSHGAIGSDGRFAIFRTEEDGVNAQRSLLFESGSYKNLTLSQAISRWAPASENNVPAYIAAMGANPNAKMGEFSREQQDILLSNMRRHEGWRPGNVSEVGPGDYSQQAIQAAQQKLIRQIEAGHIQSLAEFTTAQLPPPGSEQADMLVAKNKNATAVAERIKSEFGNLSNPQCVALAKAYVGASSSVTDWRRGTNVLDGTLKPGTPIATFMDAQGNPSSLYDNGGTGRPGNSTTHAAVFLDYVKDGNGKITGIKVMEQYAGSGGAHERVYPVDNTKFGTHNGANYYSINDTSGMPLGPNNPMLRTNPEDSPAVAKVSGAVPPTSAPTGEVSIQQMSAPQRMVEDAPLLATNKKVEADTTPASPTKVEEPKKEKPKAPEPPKVISQNYNVNINQFISKIKEMDPRASMPFVSDSMIIGGFNDDPQVKGAGVHLDDKGVMHIKDINHPEVQKMMKDMDTSKFMTPIKEEKKAEVKPTPAPEAPKPKPEAATPVKTNADGGDNKVTTSQISAYPIGGLRGDNTVVVNKNQQPLFTMNTNESLVMNPKTDTAKVIPNNRDNNLGPIRDNAISGMFSEFNQSVKELASAFDTNKPVPEQKPREDVFIPEGGAWLNNLNKVNENPYHNPTSMRSFYRANGMETGEPTNGFHFSNGNRS